MKEVKELFDLYQSEDNVINEINDKFDEMGCETSEELDAQRMAEIGLITKEFNKKKHEVFDNLITKIDSDAEKTGKLIVVIENENTLVQDVYLLDKKEEYQITLIAFDKNNGKFAGGQRDSIGKNQLTVYSFNDKSYGKVKQDLDDFENIEVLLVNDGGESESNEKVFVVEKQKSQNLFNQFAELNSDARFYMRGHYTDHNVFDWDCGDIYRDVVKFVKANTKK